MSSFSRENVKGKVLANNCILTLLLVFLLLSTAVITTVECSSATNEYHSNNHRVVANNWSNHILHEGIFNEQVVLQHHCIHGDHLFQEKLFNNVYATGQQKLNLTFMYNSYSTATDNSSNNKRSNVFYEQEKNVNNKLSVENTVEINRALTNSSEITTTTAWPKREEFTTENEEFRRESEEKEKETRNFAPIRIRFDTTHLYERSYVCTEVGQVRPDFLGGNVTCSASDIMTEAMRDMITQHIIPHLIHRTQRLIDVRRLTHPLHVPVEACGRDVHIPHSHRASNRSSSSEHVNDSNTASGSNGGVPETDLLIYALAAPMSDKKSNTNTIAWSSYCVLDESDHGRPIVARINFVPYHIHHCLRQLEMRYGVNALMWMHDVNALVYEGDAEDEWMEQYMRFVLHEMCHALGFTPLFLNTLSQVWSQRGREVHSVNSPTVVQTAEHFLHCYSANSSLALHGVDLENEGEEGTVFAHWERREFHDELMVGVPSSNNAVLSSLTLSFFASLPFYKVHMEYAQPMKWGKHAGCSFLEPKCTHVDNQNTNNKTMSITEFIDDHNHVNKPLKQFDSTTNIEVIQKSNSRSNYSVSEFKQHESSSKEKEQLTLQKYWCTDSATSAYPQLQCTYDRRSVGICNVDFNTQPASHNSFEKTHSKNEISSSTFEKLRARNTINARGRSLLMDGCPIVEPISSMTCTKVLAPSIHLPFSSISASEFYFGPQSRCVRTSKLTEHLHFSANQDSSSNSDMPFLKRAAHVVENKWNEFKDYVLSFVYENNPNSFSDSTSVESLLLSSTHVQPVVQLDGASCLRVRCLDGVQVQIQVGMFWFECPANGSAGVLRLPSWSGFTGDVYCEHYSLICTPELFVERSSLYDDNANNNNKNKLTLTRHRYQERKRDAEFIAPIRTRINGDVTNKEEYTSNKLSAMSTVYPWREYRVIIGLHIGLAYATQKHRESNFNPHLHNFDEETNEYSHESQENEKAVNTEAELLKWILTSQQGKLQAALEDDISSAINVKLDTHEQNTSVKRIRTLPYFAAAVITAEKDKVNVNEKVNKEQYHYSRKLHEQTSAAAEARTSKDKYHFEFPRWSQKRVEAKQNKIDDGEYNQHSNKNTTKNNNTVSFIGLTLSLAVSAHQETEVTSLASTFISMLHERLPLQHLTQVIMEYNKEQQELLLQQREQIMHRTEKELLQEKQETKWPSLPELTTTPFLISYNVIDNENNTASHSKHIINSTSTITSFLISEACVEVDDSSAFDDTSHWVDLAAVADIQFTLQITHYLHRTVEEEKELNNNIHSLNNDDGKMEITDNKGHKSVNEWNKKSNNNQLNYTDSNNISINHKTSNNENKAANPSEKSVVLLWKELQSIDKRNILALSLREDLAKVLGLTHNLVAITSVDLSAHYMTSGKVNDDEDITTVNSKRSSDNNNNTIINNQSAEEVILNEVIEMSVGGTIYLSPLMTESGVNHTPWLYAREYTLQEWQEWLSCNNHTAEWDATTCHLVELCTGAPLGAPVVVSSSSSLFQANRNDRRSAVNVKTVNFTLTDAQPHVMRTKTTDNMHVHDSHSLFSYYRHHRSLSKYCFTTSSTTAFTTKSHVMCLHLMDVLLFLTIVTLIMLFTFLVKSKYVRFLSRERKP